ncbi:N-acetylglucosaminyldiphosphoundecaprenol N-acetyl-beta-D-mannosaminyltransferase [Thermomicrobium roseum DSM 5159]|uniref:N-acetylglucosaminyldiphosphoundecaprenol N-acetyl-beta-D-mannosaminyltransferase n=2 Tax=Thermomicrobium roseum TaxID=500 RepID=B9L049_THERP|nr:N-acetylglucosaminyldiphosphoundecaprenol N-acetyl-beta-D-mannosaminyltransferase [Thermomicrobium roseum DSM 5159]
MRPEDATGRMTEMLGATGWKLRRVLILGLPVHDVTLAEAVQLILAWSREASDLQQVITLNPEMVMAARRDPAFRAVVERAALVTPDGIGLILAAHWRGTPLRGRVTGVDLVEALARTEVRLFFLGAAPGVAERAAAVLARSAGATIVGTWAGSPRPEDAPETLARIAAARPDVLCVAYGAPAQDCWIARHRTELTAAGVRVALGVGGTFDYLAGIVPRPPRIVRHLGLEWLYRLLRQPWRWRRQLVLPHFALLALADGLANRLAGREHDEPEAIP